MPKKYGLLTEHQLRVLKLRSRGLSLREIASKLGKSHQNIAVIEKRALENIETAKQTLLAYKLATAPLKIRIDEDIKLVEIPRIIMDEADKNKLKVRGDFTLVFKLIRFKARKCIEGSKVKEPIMIIVDQNGEINVYPYKDIEQLYNQIQEL